MLYSGVKHLQWSIGLRVKHKPFLVSFKFFCSNNTQFYLDTCNNFTSCITSKHVNIVAIFCPFFHNTFASDLKAHVSLMPFLTSMMPNINENLNKYPTCLKIGVSKECLLQWSQNWHQFGIKGILRDVKAK